MSERHFSGVARAKYREQRNQQAQKEADWRRDCHEHEVANERLKDPGTPRVFKHGVDYTAELAGAVVAKVGQGRKAGVDHHWSAVLGGLPRDSDNRRHAADLLIDMVNVAQKRGTVKAVSAIAAEAHGDDELTYALMRQIANACEGLARHHYRDFLPRVLEAGELARSHPYCWGLMPQPDPPAPTKMATGDDGQTSITPAGAHPVDDPPEQTWIVSHGNQCYSINGYSFAATIPQNCVLAAFIGCPAMNRKMLAKRSDLDEERASKEFLGIIEKHPAVAAAMKPAGKKGGSYRANVKPANT